MTKMKISEEGISLIKNYEGCRLEAYQDSVGIWTIGYGVIKGVKEGDKINQEEADHLLQEELPEYEGYINDMIKVPLEQCQFDALVCWVYNLGPNNLKDSTLSRSKDGIKLEALFWQDWLKDVRQKLIYFKEKNGRKFKCHFQK